MASGSVVVVNPVIDKSRLPLPTWLYVIGWLFFVYTFIQILSFRAENPNSILLSGLYFIEFGVHEVSHIITMFLPPLFVAMAGSLGEVGFTVLLLIATLRAKAYFASVFAGLWVMLAMHNVGLYIADARSQLLPLVGPSETVQHDWHFILGQLGWLNSDAVLGGIVQGLGIAIGAIALGWGLFLIINKVSRLS